MVHKVLGLLFSLFVYGIANSQVWHEKSQIFQIGVGDNLLIKKHIEENRKLYSSKSTGSYGKMEAKSTPALFVKLERAINRYIGVGISIGYRKTEITQILSYTYYDTTVLNPKYIGGIGIVYTHPQVTANDIYNFKIHDLSAGAKVNCHFLPGKKIDPYIGVAVGYRLFNRDYSYTTDNPKGVYYVVDYEDVLPIYFSGTLGIRYLFTTDLGVYAEVGLDKWSVVQGGILFKIK